MNKKPNNPWLKSYHFQHYKLGRIMGKTPKGPPTLFGFAFHCGTLVAPAYMRFDYGLYMFQERQRVSYQRLTISRFWGISYKLGWVIGFFTFSDADHLNEEVK